MVHDDDNSHGHASVGNPDNIKEPDSEISHRIRPIELIKHNPNLFHLQQFSPSAWWTVLGGAGWAASAATGALFGTWYYNQKLLRQPDTFYVRILLRFSRLFLGFAVGSFVGYLRFGDRQQLHNAWVAERLRRRYPESKNLDTRDLWRFKGVKAQQEYYRWT